MGPMLLLLLVFTFLCYSRAGPAPLPADFCSGKADGAYPLAEGQCMNKYFVCSNNVVSLLFCPDPLAFDTELRICNHQEYVGVCGGAPEKTKLRTTTIFECPRTDGDFPVPGDLCGSSYYSCVGGIATARQCNPGELFDVDQCRPSKEVEGCNFNCNGQTNGMYSEGCSPFYWWCWDGKGTKNQCPTDLFFNPDFGQCTLQDEIVICGGTPTTTTERAPPATTTTEKLDIDCFPLPDGDYGHPNGGCLEFYFSCSGSRGSQRNCPAGLRWDDEVKRCGRPSEVTACGGTPTSRTPIAVAFMCPTQSGQYPDPDQPCSGFYYRCDMGFAQRAECNSGLIFNSDASRCDPPSTFSCQGSPLNPPTGSFVCPRPSGDFADPARPCTKYYFWCSNGQAQLLQCVGNQIFNSITARCDNARRVPGCGIPAETIPPTYPKRPPTIPAPPSTTPAPPPGFVCPRPFGDFPDPSRPCTDYYYWCSNSQARLVRCLDGNIYSPETQECDTPANVRSCRVSEPPPTAPPPTTRAPPPTTRAPPPTTRAPPPTTRAPPPTTRAPPPGFVCPRPFGDFADPSRQCTKYYYWCTNGQARLVECLDREIYDPDTQDCDAPDNVRSCPKKLRRYLAYLANRS